MKYYKAVSGPMNISVSKGNTQDAFNMFAALINNEARAGWQYHSMETISVTQSGGCLSSPVTTNHYMLIFYREG